MKWGKRNDRIGWEDRRGERRNKDGHRGKKERGEEGLGWGRTRGEGRGLSSRDHTSFHCNKLCHKLAIFGVNLRQEQRRRYSWDPPSAALHINSATQTFLLSYMMQVDAEFCFPFIVPPSPPDLPLSTCGSPGRLYLPHLYSVFMQMVRGRGLRWSHRRGGGCCAY